MYRYVTYEVISLPSRCTGTLYFACLRAAVLQGAAGARARARASPARQVAAARPGELVARAERGLGAAVQDALRVANVRLYVDNEHAGPASLCHFCLTYTVASAPFSCSCAAPSRVLNDDAKQPENYVRTAFPASRASTLPLGMYSIGKLIAFPLTSGQLYFTSLLTMRSTPAGRSSSFCTLAVYASFTCTLAFSWIKLNTITLLKTIYLLCSLSHLLTHSHTNQLVIHNKKRFDRELDGDGHDTLELCKSGTILFFYLPLPWVG